MDESPKLHVVKHDLGVETECAYIIPLSDLHIGSHFNEDKFLGYREWIMTRDNAYCVINGDVLEMVTRNSIGNIYEQLRPKQQKEIAIKFLRPLAEAGKILAYLDGNHEQRVAKDSDEYVGEYICGMLGIPSIYNPDGIYMFLSLGYDSNKGRSNRLIYTVFMLHGWTGARTIGGKANNLSSLAQIVDAEIYISSHTHQKVAFPMRKPFPDVNRKRLIYKKQMFVSAGSFLDWEGYSVRRGYQPVSLGSPRIRLDGRRRDVHVSI